MLVAVNNERSLASERIRAGRVDLRCPGCGYNMRGAAGDVCPECGRVAALRELSVMEEPTLAMWYRAAGWGVLVGALGSIVPGLTGVVVGLGEVVGAIEPMVWTQGAGWEEGIVLAAIGLGLLGAPMVMLWVLQTKGAEIHFGPKWKKGVMVWAGMALASVGAGLTVAIASSVVVAAIASMR